MPTVAISSECHKAIKEYLVDIDNYEIGQFIQDAVFFAMDHIEEFEEAIGMEEVDVEDEEEDAEDATDGGETLDPSGAHRTKKGPGGGWY